MSVYSPWDRHAGCVIAIMFAVEVVNENRKLFLFAPEALQVLKHTREYTGTKDPYSCSKDRQAITAHFT